MRCGRFICEACDADEGKHCIACSAWLAAEAAAPWRGRRRRAKVVLGLAVGMVLLAFVFHHWLENILFLVLLTLGICLAMVAAIWDALAWEQVKRDLDPNVKTQSPVYVVGGGCLLALVAAVAFVSSIPYWP